MSEPALYGLLFCVPNLRSIFLSFDRLFKNPSKSELIFLSEELLTQHQIWKTNPCRTSATSNLIYSQLPFYLHLQAYNLTKSSLYSLRFWRWRQFIPHRRVHDVPSPEFTVWRELLYVFLWRASLSPQKPAFDWDYEPAQMNSPQP
jgi:hypothetical protein